MIRIITTLYNSVNYVGACIESIKAQSYKNWKCYITNDMSNDGSGHVARQHIDDDKRFEVIDNESKHFQIGNMCQVIYKEEIEDDDIIITVDGDDFLPDPDVFKRVIKEYEANKELWITYGSFLHWHGHNNTSSGFAMPPAGGIKNIRNARWTTTHLRTFKAFLYRKIRKEDLVDHDGDYASHAGDLYFMMPMLEMAGDSHSKYLKDINYLYNVETNMNEYKTDLRKQNFYANYARKKAPYQEL